jgi:hypothetical protein
MFDLTWDHVSAFDLYRRERNTTAGLLDLFIGFFEH